ncbi:hypothetical protein GCM10009838_51610 [Catenulispora subtropica]|uniref:Uncharacterized protein n=1 Tax=Catenulispora subtropica TaxID=450798 RepID=A0ABP5DNP5_9ACTN
MAFGGVADAGVVSVPAAARVATATVAAAAIALERRAAGNGDLTGGASNQAGRTGTGRRVRNEVK